MAKRREQENGGEKREIEPFLPLKEAGISYSVSALFPAVLALFVGLILGAANAADGEAGKYVSFLLPQICFAAAAILFFRRSKVSPRESYAPCKWYFFPIALLMEFGLLFCLGELNGLFTEGLVKLGYKPAEGILPSLEGWNLLPAVLVIALLPAVFEEILFRGILTGSMRRAGWGTASAVLVSGALFSLFHHNPEQTVYQFICGVCYALLAVRAGSVFPSMLAHFCNNALILFLTAFGPMDEAGNLVLPAGGYVALVVCAGACFIASALFLILFRGRERHAWRTGYAGKYFLFAAPGIALCSVEWIVQLIEGCL